MSDVKNYKQKYFKYKQKYIKMKNKFGGSIESNDVLKNILSIGFEFETVDIIPLKISDNNSDTNTIILSNLRSTNDEIRDKLLTIIDDFEVITTKDHGAPYNRINFDAYLSFNDLNNTKYLMKKGQYGHTEFHFTFTNLNYDDNIIYNYICLCCNYINKIFKNKQEVLFEPIPETLDLSNYDKKNEIIKFLKEKQTKICNFFNYENLYFLNYKDPNTKFYFNDDVKWIIQTTIGITLNNVISVLNYLSLGSDRKIFWDNAVEIAELNIIKFKEYLTENNIDIDENYINLLLNWTTLVMYKFQFMKTEVEYYGEIYKVDNDSIWETIISENNDISENYDIQIPAGKSFLSFDRWFFGSKSKLTFSVRHRYRDFFPKSTKYDVHLLNFVKQVLILKEPTLYPYQIYYYILIFLIYKVDLLQTPNFDARSVELFNEDIFGFTDNEDFKRGRIFSDVGTLNNLAININETKLLPFENNIILIEFRGLFKQISKQIGIITGNEKLDNCNLTNLKLLCNEKLQLYV